MATAWVEAARQADMEAKVSDIGFTEINIQMNIVDFHDWPLAGNGVSHKTCYFELKCRGLMSLKAALGR